MGWPRPWCWPMRLTATALASANGFGFRQRLRQLGLEFFLQVTPQEHSGWTEEVPTVLNGKYRTVEEATAQRARTLLEMAQALFNGAAFTPYGPGQWKSPEREGGPSEPEVQKAEREQDRGGREM